MRKFATILLVLPLSCLCGCQPVIKKEDRVRQKIVYLKKANNDLVSFCDCGDGHITYPPQLSCPWCGCGWLFTCMQCRKAFTFAEGVEVESSWEELARRDIANRHYKPLTDAEVAHWIKTMRRLLRDVRLRKLYVCFDGRVFERDARNVEFEGWYARHHFQQMPHVAAMSDATVKTNLLRSEAYWKSHALKKL